MTVVEKSKKTQAHQRYRLKPTVDWPKGQIVPGVTTIVNILAKPALIPWANKLGLQGIDVGKYVDDKADIGTLGHTMVENLLQGKETDFSDYTANQKLAAENSVLSFLNWQKNHKIEVIFVEKQLVSEEHHYGGTGDIYAKVDDALELIEIKTGKGIWPEHFIQTAANFSLLKENGYQVDRCRILNIPRGEGEAFAEVIVPNIGLNYDLFHHCLQIYNIRKQLKGGDE
jgi:hypothetical protein